MAVLPPPQPRPEPLFPGPLTDEALRALFEGAADFVARQIAVPGGMIGLYFIDGLVSGADISEYVIGPMVRHLADLPPEAQAAQAVAGAVNNAVADPVDTLEAAAVKLVNGFAVMIFFVVVYLLSKMIIEKNAQSISMTKILGYNGSEIARLYLLSTTVVVVLCLVISLPIEVYVMKFLFRAVMMESMTGWIEMWVSPTLYPRMLAAGLATYAVVAVLEYRRIIRVPMDEALKNVE